MTKLEWYCERAELTDVGGVWCEISSSGILSGLDTGGVHRLLIITPCQVPRGARFPRSLARVDEIHGRGFARVEPQRTQRLSKGSDLRKSRYLRSVDRSIDPNRSVLAQTMAEAHPARRDQERYQDVRRLNAVFLLMVDVAVPSGVRTVWTLRKPAGA